MRTPKAYLYDGVYVEHDGFALWLSTSDGYSTTNLIALEPETYAALLDYVKRGWMRMVAALHAAPIPR